MRIHVNHYLTVLSLIAFLALPVWAHTDSAQLTVLNATTIGGRQLKPGTYKLEVKPDQTQMKVVNTSTHRTVAEVPVHWVHVNNPPDYTQVILNKHQVQEVVFSGKTQAVRIG
jgi:hypothetical protein